jgi:hypothetical protein
MPLKTKQRDIITDKLVVEKTGKNLEDWYLLLDKKGAQKMNSAAIYTLVASLPGIEPLGEWNQGLLSTSYCWSRGLKERGQKENGFEVSVSKTIGVALPLLYKAFVDNHTRLKWLGKEPIEIRKATENKSARITWSDKASSLSVDFYAKGNGKAQVVVQHQKITNSKKAEELKQFWIQKLDSLKIMLEK